MSELISGKEALIALANGEEVEFLNKGEWGNVGEMIIFKHFTQDSFKFRIKPRTIKIGDVEIPAPFTPKRDDKYWHIYALDEKGYSYDYYEDNQNDERQTMFGAWKSEDEIKQVVAALRQVFKGNP